MVLKSTYQMYVELAGYSPAMWRRLLLHKDTTMAELSYILMALFEMDGSHMFAFDIPVVKNLKFRAGKTTPEDKDALEKFERLTGKNNVRIEIPTEFTDDFMGNVKVLDSRDVTLADIFAKKAEKAVFNYDYGDSWEINIKIEKIITDKELDGKELPCVLAGEGSGIIEDCGGIWGLANIAEAFEKGSGEQYDEYMEWLGDEEVDLAFFDIEIMNSKIKKWASN